MSNDCRLMHLMAPWSKIAILESIVIMILRDECEVRCDGCQWKATIIRPATTYPPRPSEPVIDPFQFQQRRLENIEQLA